MNHHYISETHKQEAESRTLPSHGFLVLDKPEGISSAAAVAQVKKLLNCKKVGHGGTLDPLASGVLPLAIGEATKAFDYVASSIKEYRFVITFGEERSTDDREGEVMKKCDSLPSCEVLAAALPDFIGTILQTPPVYSALKIDGERAYKRARAGENVEMKAREVEIFDLKLEERDKWQVARKKNSPATPHLSHATFLVTCGKGTYIRALARDIARKCNSLGYVSYLRRTRVGNFIEANAISLDKLPQFMHNPALFKAWMPIELALDDIPAIDMDSIQSAALRHGKTIRASNTDGSYMALHHGHLVALVDCKDGILKSTRVFNLN